MRRGKVLLVVVDDFLNNKDEKSSRQTNQQNQESAAQILERNARFIRNFFVISQTLVRLR